MKTQNLLAVVAGLVLLAGNLSAQTTPSTPPLAYGVPQILQLSQAKVSDDIIVAYVRNSGNSYGLDADQIIYLRQQGVSDNVLTTMLSQPKPAATPEPTLAPVASAASQPVNTSAIVYSPPAPTYVQTVPSSTVYVIPDTRAYFWNTYHTAPYIYPYYTSCYPSYYPGVSLSFGFGGGYRGGYYAGYRGGGYHGGGYHGGWHH
jgi:hypothetical protein